jgi:hypothetical protein
MDLSGDWIATKNDMLDTLLAAIDEILNADRATGELRADVTAEDIAASLVGIFTVAHPAPAPRQGKPPAEHPDGRPPTCTLNRPSAAMQVRTRLRLTLVPGRLRQQWRHHPSAS